MSQVLYIADAVFNQAVRKVDASGVITTPAIISSDPIWLGNGGWETPWGMAIDPTGNLFVCDEQANVVYKIDSGGNLTTVAGTGALGLSGIPGPALSAHIGLSQYVACDAAGNLYISNVNASGIGMVILAVNMQATTQTLFGVSIPAGNIAVIAGGNGLGYAGIPGPAVAATFTNPDGIAIDAAGNLYICAQGNSPGNQPSTAILKVDPSGNISNIAGDPSIVVTTNSGDGGLATAAGLGDCLGIALDTSGNLYITGTGHQAWCSVRAVNRQATPQTILGVTINPGNIATVAGSTSAKGYGGDGGSATAALLNVPWSSAVDSSGNLYIADSLNFRVRLVNTSGTISTAAGNGTRGYTGDSGPATAAEISQSFGIALVPAAGPPACIAILIQKASGVGGASFAVPTQAGNSIIVAEAGNGAADVGSAPTDDKGNLYGNPPGSYAQSSGFNQAQVFYSAFPHPEHPGVVHVTTQPGVLTWIYELDCSLVTGPPNNANEIDVWSELTGGPATSLPGDPGLPACGSGSSGGILGTVGDFCLSVCVVDTGAVTGVGAPWVLDTVQSGWAAAYRWAANTTTVFPTFTGSLSTNYAVSQAYFTSQATALTCGPAGPFCPVQLIDGNFMDALGNRLAYGALKLQLTSDTLICTHNGQLVAGRKFNVGLDENGNIAGIVNVEPNDLLLPAGTKYRTLAYASDGRQAWARPQYWTVPSTAATLDVGTLVPSA